MHKTVLGKNLLVNFFLIAAAILLMLIASFTTTIISGPVVKLSMHTSVYKIITAKNIKRTTNKQAGKLVESDIRKQWLQ